jgi:ribosomal protein S12 methylthiotransferase accessory factor
LSGENLFVPYEMVHMDYTTPLPDGHGCFTASSNGLASGNRVVEAISQGICEVIERDATTLWKLHGEEKLKHNPVDLKSVDEPICQEILGKLERAGLYVAVWDITSDIPIATFACFIVPRDESLMWHCMVSTGYGCHPARDVALLRALTEAAQSRLTVISGARDDFRHDDYDQWLDLDLFRSTQRQMMSLARTRRFRDVPDWDGETFEDDVEWELKCIKKAGIRSVVVIDLTKPEFALPVVRVIVPGLEPALQPGYVPGRRGQFILAKEP